MNPLWPSQHPRPEQLIVHLSDTHLTAGGAPLLEAVDADAALVAAIRGLEASGLRPDAIVVTGDVADTGADDAYARVRALLEPVAAELDARLVWVMGNHDRRAPFRTRLLDQPAGDEPVDAVYDLDGLRLIALDSTVPGFHYGELTDAQLDWLTELLATPAPRGSVLALHHPPIPSPQLFDELIELRHQAGLEAVLRGSDVRAILAGHLHYSTHGTFAGIPVSVASATCYTNDPLLSAFGLRAQAGAQAFDLVHVYADRMLHTTVPVGDFPTVYEVTAEQARQILALPEEQQRELATAYITVGGLDRPPTIIESMTDSRDADEKLIRELEDERHRAIVDGDYEAAAALWDDRLSYIHSSADVDTKASYLEKLHSGWYVYHSVDHPIERIVFAGGLAFVYGRMIADIHAGGAPKHLDSVTTAVWGPAADGWKLVHFQSTPVPH